MAPLVTSLVSFVAAVKHLNLPVEGGKEGGKEGRREEGRKEGGRKEGGKEGGRERGREGEREGGREGGREGRREGSRCGEGESRRRWKLSEPPCPAGTGGTLLLVSLWNISHEL